ncbi:MAG: hypothetical protein JHD16_04235 [Solirubrobacteraceae bacterium]|nr:hypothetical protein [Solirubrobacteraceae bacterium]
MSHSTSRPLSLRALRVLWSLAVALVSLAVLAGPASAAITTMSGTDPIDASTPPLDLTAGKVVYDSTAGKATLTVETAAPTAGASPALVYALLGRESAGQCLPDAEAASVLFFSLSYTGEGDFTKWVATPDVSLNDAATTRSGTTITSTAGPSSTLRSLGFTCAQIQTRTQVPNEAAGAPDDVDVDQMNVFVAAGGNTPNSGAVPPPVFTDQPDKDKDGVPDTKDACPAEPGAAANGCLTIPARLAVRLGAKRVVIDKLVSRTGAACPIKAKVKVVSKKKTIGSGVVSVSAHGSYCRAYGVVRLKKTAKVAKITVTAAGMGSIGATRRR